MGKMVRMYIKRSESKGHSSMNLLIEYQSLKDHFLEILLYPKHPVLYYLWQKIKYLSQAKWNIISTKVCPWPEYSVLFANLPFLHLKIHRVWQSLKWRRRQVFQQIFLFFWMSPFKVRGQVRLIHKCLGAKLALEKKKKVKKWSLS